MPLFQGYDEYMKAFGGALAGAATPEQPAMAPGAFGGAGPNIPPRQPPMQAPMQNQEPPVPPGAFGPAPGSAAGPAPAAPSGPAFAAPPPAAPAEGGGMNMKDVLDKASDEEKKEFVAEWEKQIPNLEEKASETALKDPELAAKYKTGAPDTKWDKAEAAAFLMEFGLRMMQASGTGQGNFFSDVGGSALGAFDARRAAKDKERQQAMVDADRATAAADREEDRAWQAKERAREEGNWAGEDREKVRERKRKAAEEMRKGQTHELNKQIAELSLRGSPITTINEDNELVVTYPGSGTSWNTGVKAGSRDAGGRVSAFVEQLDAWRQTAAGLNETAWEDMTPKQQSQVEQAFYDYQKTGVNTKGVRSKFIADWVLKARDSLPKHANEERTKEVIDAARAQANEIVNDIYGPEGDDVGGIPIFKKGPPPDATTEEIAAWYADPANQ